MFTKQDLNIFKSASKDDSRPILTGVQIRATKITDTNGGAFNSPGGYKIQLAATDSYRLTEKVIHSSEDPGFESLLIPGAKLQEVAKLMKNTDTAKIEDGKFKIYDKDGNPGTEISLGEQIDGNYPDWEKLLPVDDNPPKAVITLNPRYLKDAMDQTSGVGVEIEVRGPYDPVIIRDTVTGETKTMAVVMPLRK